MKRGQLQYIAKQLDISTPYLCLILQGKRRPSWQRAKSLALITKTKPELWLDGEPERIKAVLEEINF